jgi:aminoglycoside phosphotransferase (APT) family kinase protein
MSVLQFPNGAANLTYRVSFRDTHLVVRRPPFGQLAPGAHDMRREHTVLATLHQAYDRAPRSLLLCDDHSVIGSDFVVTEYRPGVVVWGSLPETMTSPDAGRQVGLAVVDALAELHQVDPAACGLAGLGRPDGFLERQVRGWARRWEAVALEGDSGLMQSVSERLAAGLPRSQGHSVLHLDFKVDNCQFAPGDPSRVVSVFDWDMATLGDPLVDLAMLLGYWPDPADTAEDAALVVPGLETLGLPRRAEVVQRYAEASPRDLAVLPWYQAFACWRTAIVLQQLYVRWVRGESTDERMATRGDYVEGLARRATTILDRHQGGSS